MTLKRLRAYTTLIAITLWSVWIIDLSRPGPIDRLGKVKGTDFLQFYGIGSLVRDHRWGELYDIGALNDLTHAVAPTSRETVFIPVQSPQLALLFLPLAYFPYTVALLMWLLVSVLLYAGSCVVLWRTSKALRTHRYLVISSALASPAFFMLVINGQTSALSLACLVSALLAMRQGRPFLAGLAVGMMVLKPHWVAAAGAVFVVAREWRIVAGIVVGALGELAIAWLVVGSSVMQAYGQVLLALPGLAKLLEPQPGDSLKSYWEVLVPWQPVSAALYVATGLATTLVAAHVWGRHPSLAVRFAAVVLAIVLISPHVFPYDLILLLPIYFLLGNWMAESTWTTDRRPLALLLCACYLAPLLSGLPPLVRLQFSVGAMAVLLVLLWRDAHRSVLVTGSVSTMPSL
jgi:hypothetical protein